MTLARQFLQFAELRRDKVKSFKSYPFNLPVIRHLEHLDFHPAVTFFIGENGSGKSTLLEAIATAWGFNAEGGSKNFSFATATTHSELGKFLRLARNKKATDGFFLRAESFYNAASYIEGIGVSGYGGKSLHEQSHGESFLTLLTKRFRGQGLYMLDEPEAALSPQRQLALLVRLHDLVKNGSQFIIATHSPIILAYPNAQILHFGKAGMMPIAYQDTDNFQLTKRFLNNPGPILNELFRE